MVRFISDHSVAILEAAMLAVRHTADFLIFLFESCKRSTEAKERCLSDLSL